ncbi:MAG: hypothetical protein EZS28_006633 [Streblomastix strix]|uniref:Uncharacterized protein n=1 Tax=Streblomastix strix TaxID=222440 RepID=A0A5J4WTF7_9EUKA|nr:MAG: hypothetical protein EZS28_006633 [Streblomastix strix]
MNRQMNMSSSLTQRGRTRLKQGQQYVDAMIGLIDVQQALLVALWNGLSSQDNIMQILEVLAMLQVGANAVKQLRELANAPRELNYCSGCQYHACRHIF